MPREGAQADPQVGVTRPWRATGRGRSAGRVDPAEAPRPPPASLHPRNDASLFGLATCDAVSLPQHRRKMSYTRRHMPNRHHCFRKLGVGLMIWPSFTHCFRRTLLRGHFAEVAHRELWHSLSDDISRFSSGTFPGDHRRPATSPYYTSRLMTSSWTSWAPISSALTRMAVQPQDEHCHCG